MRREGNGILHFAFCLQKPTSELYWELLEQNCYVSINGHKGLFKLKGETHLIVLN